MMHLSILESVYIFIVVKKDGFFVFLLCYLFRYVKLQQAAETFTSFFSFVRRASERPLISKKKKK